MNKSKLESGIYSAEVTLYSYSGNVHIKIVNTITGETRIFYSKKRIEKGYIK